MRGGTTEGTPTAYELSTVFRPRLWRIVVLQLLPVAVTIIALLAAIGLFVHFWSSLGSHATRAVAPVVWLLGFLAIGTALTGVTAWQSRRGYSVEVGSGRITVNAPATLSLARRQRGQVQYALDLDDIDRQRSCRRTCADRLTGRHRLYSTYDTRIPIRRRLFSRPDFQRLLGMLNIRE